MRVNEVKETKEVVIGTQYIAEDGTVFKNESECRKYEESALFAISRQLPRLIKPHTASIYSLIDEGCEDDELEIFDIQTEEQLELLKRYIHLQLSISKASEKTIDSVFTGGEYEFRRKWCAIDNITVGHEVLINWTYDKDWCYTWGDGSLNSYFSYITANYNKILENNKVEEN